jgi:hypothetical protein
MSARAPILVSGSGTLRRPDDSIGCRTDDHRDLPYLWQRRVMSVLSTARRGVVRHPVLTFVLISLERTP